MQTIGSCLRDAALKFKLAGFPSPDLDARLLMMEAGGLARIKLISESNSPVTVEAVERFIDFMERRLAREPVHRIIGKRDFFGRHFALGTETLIPRPETELLVETVLEKISARPGPVAILELGTGAGIVAVSLAAEFLEAQVVATDISKDAICVAQKNALRHSVDRRIDFLCGDLFAPVEGRFDVIVSNPPYIRTRDIHFLDDEVRNHDPLAALDGGVDGLDFYRRIFSSACDHLMENGMICVEIAHDQAKSVRAIAEGQGYCNMAIYQDLSHQDRVLVAQNCCKNINSS